MYQGQSFEEQNVTWLVILKNFGRLWNQKNDKNKQTLKKQSWCDTHTHMVLHMWWCVYRWVQHNIVEEKFFKGWRRKGFRKEMKKKGGDVWDYNYVL